MSNTFFKTVNGTNVKNFYFSFIVLFLFNCSLFAQEKNFIRYTVIKGETITQIAIKYKVTPYDIYRLNPDSQTGIKENDILIIPVSNQNSSISQVASSQPKSNTNKSVSHTVKPKETLYSISRDYKVNVEDLKRSNEEILKDGLQIGQVISIPNQQGVASSAVTEVHENKDSSSSHTETVKSASNSEKTVYHVVAPKETKFGIAKEYGITVQELEQKNPEIISNLPVGYKLIIKGNSSKTETPQKVVEKPKPVVYEVAVTEEVKTEKISIAKKNGYANYEVKPKETLYSLAQMFNISQEELIELNPTLKDGVKVGMILKVPGNGSITRVDENKGTFSDLSKSINNKTKKELVLLIPFNANKIQADTTKTLAVRVKKDPFLNMTLDYYSGVLMAIDSAKTLGLNLDIKIFDSEESKLSSNVVNIVKNNNLQNADAVIGPFYQQYVEKVAELLNEKNVPVISPLSKETGKPFSNLYQTIPPTEVSKRVMYDYLLANNGNVIVVISSKKMADHEFISKKYPSAQFAVLNENGELNPDNLKSLFVKGKMNYVVLESESTSMILATTNVMLNEYSNYQLQLVITETNDTLDFEEISMKRLTILKLLYPTLNRENVSPEAIAFKNHYRKKNKIFPSQYAIRGFDITFDTMLRLSQNESFEVSAKNDKTQQIESKFKYVKDDASQYINEGVYILQYVEDYSVKQIN